MRIDLRYFSKNGGTKRLAEAVAKEVGVEALTVDKPLEKYADIVFLGASVYGGKPAPEVVDFVIKNGKNIGKIVVFGTSAAGKSAYAAIKAVAAGCGVKTAEMFFHCPGKFLFLHQKALLKRYP